MTWDRTDLTVGLVVIATVVVVAGTLLWMTPVLGDRSYPIYTHFANVEGISARTPVQLNGYRVGFVKAVEPHVTGDGTLRFRVEMAIERRLGDGADFRLADGTRALFTPPPLPIGSGQIVLAYPPDGGAPLEPGSTIPGERARVATDQLETLTSNVDRELAETTRSARTLMDSLTVTATALNHSLLVTQAAIPPIVEGLRLELAAAEALTTDLRTHLNALAPATLAGVDSATALLADSRRMVQQMTGVIASTQGEIGTILANLDTTTVLVESLVRQFSDRPLRVFLTGAEPTRGYSRPR